MAGKRRRHKVTKQQRPVAILPPHPKNWTQLVLEALAVKDDDGEYFADILDAYHDAQTGKAPSKWLNAAMVAEIEHLVHQSQHHVSGSAPAATEGDYEDDNDGQGNGQHANRGGDVTGFEDADALATVRGKRPCDAGKQEDPPSWGHEILECFDVLSEDLETFADMLNAYNAARLRCGLSAYSAAPLADVEELVREGLEHRKNMWAAARESRCRDAEQRARIMAEEMFRKESPATSETTTATETTADTNAMTDTDAVTTPTRSASARAPSERPQSPLLYISSSPGLPVTPIRASFRIPRGRPRGTKSHFFEPITPTPAPRRSRSRRPAGTVSCLPFPPLSKPQFGLIQEELADDPFWLLIAVTFLIKTKGQVAIPVFRRVRERFPAPEHLADPANEQELLIMVHHLGLARNRVRTVRRYARLWIERPPRPHWRFKVRGYATRDADGQDPSTRPKPHTPKLEDKTGCKVENVSDSGSDDGTLNYGLRGASTPPKPISLDTPVSPPDIPADEPSASASASQRNMDSWEVGHLTQGPYAIDSWRIFCRDKLLERATNWNGGGRSPEFQPEWMRVQPRDKELRAFLQWMWMRDGWEWDPVTGERGPLSERLRQAVEDGRVEWDETGALFILDWEDRE